MQRLATLTVAFIVTATVGLVPVASRAAESGGLGIYPTGQSGSPAPWFRYQLARGASLAASLTLQNYSELPMDILVYPVDATLTGNGGFGMLPQTAPLNDAGSWIGLVPLALHLEPHSTRTIPFRFSVPSSASVGPHYAGIVAQPIQPTTPPGSTGTISLNVVSRVGVRLYETVPGAAHPRLAIDWLHHTSVGGRVSLTIALHNAGNTLAMPAGQVTLSGRFGRPAARLAMAGGRSLRPGQSLTRRLPTTLSSAGWPQHYTVRVRLVDGAANHADVVTTTISFWTGNWALATARVLTVLLLLIGGGLTWRKTRPRAR